MICLAAQNDQVFMSRETFVKWFVCCKNWWGSIPFHQPRKADSLNPTWTDNFEECFHHPSENKHAKFCFECLTASSCHMLQHDSNFSFHWFGWPRNVRSDLLWTAFDSTWFAGNRTSTRFVRNAVGATHDWFVGNHFSWPWWPLLQPHTTISFGGFSTSCVFDNNMFSALIMHCHNWRTQLIRNLFKPLQFWIGFSASIRS